MSDSGKSLLSENYVKFLYSFIISYLPPFYPIWHFILLFWYKSLVFSQSYKKCLENLSSELSPFQVFRLCFVSIKFGDTFGYT